MATTHHHRLDAQLRDGSGDPQAALVVAANVKQRLEGRHPTEKYGVLFLYRNPMLEGPHPSRTPDDLGVSSI